MTCGGMLVDGRCPSGETLRFNGSCDHCGAALDKAGICWVCWRALPIGQRLALSALKVSR